MVSGFPNSGASNFYPSGSMMIIGPVKSICFGFQQGTCNHGSHHEKDDGEHQLHVCQPCFQMRGTLVHHMSSSNKRIGAIACPFVTNASPTISSAENGQSSPSASPPLLQQQGSIAKNQERCGLCDALHSICKCIKFKHHPEALCPCPDCAKFVRYYNFGLADLCRKSNIPDFDLYSKYYDFHEDNYEQEYEQDTYSVFSDWNTDDEEYLNRTVSVADEDDYEFYPSFPINNINPTNYFPWHSSNFNHQ